MEIPEIIRRWQAGDSQRKIALGTGLSRDTIAKYVAAAQEEGIVRDGLVATAEQLSRLATIGQSGPRQAVTPGQDQLEPWADQLYQWLTGDRLQLTRIRELLGGAGVSGIVSVVAPLRPEKVAGGTVFQRRDPTIECRRSG